ncbi:LysR family transcriptional regulator [Massilia sp. R2A-15]|uniref:LysR family transcriptional regulator n=1 Tax=Massilia sp. R2A-15 TaxID=3064278 RepID=UPI0027376B38|nr:LysR family transcriptional regulator [Massilia sp. R2A-15]WLI87799.1 LysR family transcriptional regulator [Massilia sp. R2A-15]
MEMLREMAIFAQVVDSGRFSAAARQLGLTTSAVSRHVARLEAHLGGRLLHRTTRALALTELGEQVHAACARMLSTAREIHLLAGTYSARPNGVIRVTAPVVFGQVWLAPKLPAFLALYPEVDVRLTLVDRTVDLIEEGADVAIRIARELAPGLAARPLCGMRYVLVASPGYLAEHGAPATPAALRERPCMHLDYGPFGNQWTLRRGGEKVAVSVASRLTINNSGAILAAVEARGGIGLLPDFTARAALAAGRVVQLLPDWEFDEPYAGAVHAVYLPGRHLALKVRAFIDYLANTGSGPADLTPS